MTDDQTPPSIHPKKRQLSSFLYKEMLYDYLSDQLDPLRKDAVEEYLAGSKEASAELEEMRGALEYLDTFAKTQIAEPLYKQIREARSPLGQWLMRHSWSQWPEIARWSFEAFAISFVVVLLAVALGPKVSEWWPKASDSKVLFATLPKEEKPSEEPAESEAVDDISEPSEDLPLALAPVPQAAEGLKPPTPPSSTSSETNKAAPKGASEESKTVAASGEESPAEDEETEVVSSAKPDKETPKMKGFIYRAFMELDQLDVLTERIASDISSLGGKKAGQVPLGWRKDKGSYYHFSMPESNYDRLLTILQSYGPVRIYKDPHPRVMPKGTIRLILWIEDAELEK